MAWYYVKDGARQGPVEDVEFDRLLGQAVVRPDTLVWREGMSDWRPYSTVKPVAAAPTPVARAPQPVLPIERKVETVSETHADAASQQPAETSIEKETPFQSTPEISRMESSRQPAGASTIAMESVPRTTVVAGDPHYCSQCGKPYPSEDLVRFGTATVCANCKDAYAQRLRETGEVAGARVYGGFWIRFLAVLIDGIALWIVNFAIETVTGTRVTNPRDLSLVMGALAVNFIISTGISLVYEAYFLVQYGATPGKMVFKLKVITPDGGPISWGRAVGRYFAKILSAITLMIGYIMAGFDPEKRALHDYIAGTRVIRTS